MFVLLQGRGWQLWLCEALSGPDGWLSQYKALKDLELGAVIAIKFCLRSSACLWSIGEKKTLLKSNEREESSGKPFPGCAYNLIRLEVILIELSSSGFVSTVTRATRSSGLAAYMGPGWILQCTKIDVTGDDTVWGGRQLGNVSLNSVTLQKHGEDMHQVGFESRNHSAQEKHCWWLLMGTASYDAPCVNCPLLAMLREVTANMLGLLSDYPFLAAPFSSFSWCSCYFSSSWSGGKAHIASHLPRVSARQLIVRLPMKLSRHSDVLSKAQS